MYILIAFMATFEVVSAGRVDIDLELQILSGITTDTIIELPSIMAQIDNSRSLQSLTGDAKVSALVSSLQSLTGAAQAPYVTKLVELGLKYEQFWASNIILVKQLNKSGLGVLKSFLDEHAIIRPQYTASIDAVVESNLTQIGAWGVQKIRAPSAWVKHQGEGIVIGIIDVGVNAHHVALSSAYGGAWADPYYNSAAPYDASGHGTHCMGTALGRASGIGVAPQAKWIACKGFNDQGSGTEAGLTTCGQFMLTANPKPHVVINNWMGGSATWFNSIISAWRNAGIIPLFGSVGGSGCGSISWPGNQPNIITIGTSTQVDTLTSSSRGPGANGIMKPDFVAPGIQILSCGTGTSGLVLKSGSSMATSHAAGAIALILSAYPNSTFSEVYDALRFNTIKPPLEDKDRECGLIGDRDYPNNAWGHGRIDVAFVGN